MQVSWDIAATLGELGAIVWRAEAETLRIRYVSESAEAVLGYPAGAWVEDPAFLPRRLVDAERARVLSAFEAAAAAERASDRELRDRDLIEHGFIDASGRVRRFRSRARVVTHAPGEAKELAVLMVEAPERDDERALASITVDDDAALTVSTDASGRIQVFGEACETLTGWPQARARGRPIWELITRDDERAALQKRFAEGDVPEMHIAHWPGARGEERFVAWSSRASRSPEGALKGVIFTGVDITDREQNEIRLRKAEARHERLLDQLPAVLWTTDRHLVFTSSKGAALAKLGVRPNQLVGLSLFAYFGTTSADDPKIAPSLRALEGQTVTYDAEWVGRIFQVVIIPLRDPGGEITGTIGLALDVTGRVEAERERDRLLVAERRARDEAQRAIALRDEFLSIASHELSSPVTTLQLALESLASQPPAGDAADRLVDIGRKQAARLAKLLGELFDVARIRAGKLAIAPAEMDLADAAREVSSRLEPVAQRAGCELECRAPRPVRGVWDRSRIEQIITNLVENAVKHAPGAPITITVEDRDDDVVLEVSDRGEGIPADRIAHIFDRFERATAAPDRGGLGLGLYIVRKLAEAHGGRVTVDSRPGAGATFRVHLSR